MATIIGTRIPGDPPMATNVKARIKIVLHVSEINDKSDPQNRPPTEGRQSTISEEITSQVMTRDELSVAMAWFRAMMTQPWH